jgi:hypothetical protein
VRNFEAFLLPIHFFDLTLGYSLESCCFCARRLEIVLELINSLPLFENDADEQDTQGCEDGCKHHSSIPIIELIHSAGMTPIS